MATGELEYLDEAGLLALWAKIKNTFAAKATTLAGYGITDGVNSVTTSGTGNVIDGASINSNNTHQLVLSLKYAVDSVLSAGDGNAYTSLSLLDNVLTLTKGETFATSSRVGTLEGYFDSNAKLKPANMPTATASDIGGVKVGSTLAIASGILNQKSGICTADTYRSVTVDTYGRVTSGTNPTTLSGYGITDANINGDVITLGSNTIQGVTDGTQTFAGGKTFSGAVTVNILKISSTSAATHIQMSRKGANYITVPNDSSASLYINMKGIAGTVDAYWFSQTAFSPGKNVNYSLGTSSYRWNNIYGNLLNLSDSATVGTTLSVSGAATLSSTLSVGSTLTVTGGTTLGSFLKMPNDQYISFKNSGGTDIRSVAMGGNNAFLLGDYQNNGGIPTHIHGSLVTLNVGGVKKAEVDSLGITSYGGVAAMGIADLSIN